MLSDDLAERALPGFAGVSSDGKLFAWGWGGAVSSAGALQLPRLAAPGQEEAYSPRGGPQVRLRLGGGQLGVGSGVNLPSPTLVTKLEVSTRNTITLARLTVW